MNETSNLNAHLDVIRENFHHFRDIINNKFVWKIRALQNFYQNVTKTLSDLTGIVLILKELDSEFNESALSEIDLFQKYWTIIRTKLEEEKEASRKLAMMATLEMRSQNIASMKEKTEKLKQVKLALKENKEKIAAEEAARLATKKAIEETVQVEVNSTSIHIIQAQQDLVPVPRVESSESDHIYPVTSSDNNALAVSSTTDQPPPVQKNKTNKKKTKRIVIDSFSSPATADPQPSTSVFMPLAESSVNADSKPKNNKSRPPAKKRKKDPPKSQDNIAEEVPNAPTLHQPVGEPIVSATVDESVQILPPVNKKRKKAATKEATVSPEPIVETYIAKELRNKLSLPISTETVEPISRRLRSRAVARTFLADTTTPEPPKRKRAARKKATNPVQKVQNEIQLEQVAGPSHQQLQPISVHEISSTPVVEPKKKNPRKRNIDLEDPNPKGNSRKRK